MYPTSVGSSSQLADSQIEGLDGTLNHRIFKLDKGTYHAIYSPVLLRIRGMSLPTGYKLLPFCRGRLGDAEGVKSIEDKVIFRIAKGHNE